MSLPTRPLTAPQPDAPTYARPRAPLTPLQRLLDESWAIRSRQGLPLILAWDGGDQIAVCDNWGIVRSHLPAPASDLPGGPASSPPPS